MKITVILIVGIFAALFGYFINGQVVSSRSSAQIVRLQQAEQTVTKSLKLLSDDIEEKLNAFAKTVSEDRIFTLRLLAEQDRSSPDVTGFAARFLKPMGFSVLDIADSVYNIVSSGLFEANVGSDISSKISGIGNFPVLIRDNLMGKAIITLQGKKAFRIADIPFYVTGGCIIDEKLLGKLAPFDGCMVLLRIGNEIIGANKINSVSEIKENKMIINDVEYFAKSIPIPFYGDMEKPEMLIVVEKRM